jgi:hypothetical protein
MPWTCQRRSGGERCGHVNDNRKRKCEQCSKPRPPRKRPDHLKALDEPYEIWVAMFGERCGICGRGPSDTRRLDRDHDHATGRPRGLLCHRCNRGLPNWANGVWLRRAAYYLDQAA